MDRPEPDDLDGPIAAPDHHRVDFENDHVRVVRTTIRAGETAPLHTHLRPHLTVVLGGSHLIRRDASGAIMLDTRATDPPSPLPPYLWSDGTPAHTLENTGDDDIELVAVELRRPDASVARPRP